MLDPLLSLGNPSFTPKEVTYLDAIKILAGDGAPNRVYFKGKSDYSVNAWTDEAIQTFITALRGAPSPIATIFEAYGGSINRVGETETAFPHRGNTLFCLQYYIYSGRPALRPTEMWQRSAPYTTPCDLTFQAIPT